MSNRWCIIIPYLLYISTEKALKSKVTSSDIPWFFEICKCRRKPQHCQISRWYSISWGNHKSIIFGRMSSCMIWNPQVFLELADFLIFKTYEFHQVLLRNLYNMSLDVPLLNNLFTIFKPCPQKSEWFRPIKTKDLFFLVPLFSFQKPFEALNCSVCVCHVWVTCSVVGGLIFGPWVEPQRCPPFGRNGHFSAQTTEFGWTWRSWSQPCGGWKEGRWWFLVNKMMGSFGWWWFKKESPHYCWWFRNPGFTSWGW